ncbi:T9SS type A sorting domain-containing protein [Dyadobacter linearis]|uniref:T9SS type A sorting domain-containing protein n=1 Tax=Dyadobacter linearis TaxID=2823330 RepID=UPI001E54C48F|nr:T9SS type A sorting domain-containing protein [Dyadobacter sp. CECT 9623]
MISGQDQNIVIINNESVRLTYKVENTPNSKYAWNIINGQINEGNGKNEINVTWFGNPSGYGQLSLVETSIDGCMSDTAMYSVSLDIITSVQPHLSSERLLVFPNPSKNRLHIEYELKEVSNVVIDVINSSGNVVQTLNNGNLIPGKYSDIITNNLSKGIYILILDTKKNILVTKFAIED